MKFVVNISSILAKYFLFSILAVEEEKEEETTRGRAPATATGTTAAEGVIVASA